MSLNETDAQTIENHLNQIYNLALSKMTDQDRIQVRQYIAAGEYGLALDDMADIVLESKKTVAPELRSLFYAVATKMKIEPGAGWSGVDSILKPNHEAVR